jgi:hypothetical protein
MTWILRANYYESKLTEFFPYLTTIQKIYIILTTSCEAIRNFTKLSVVRNKFRLTMLEGRLNYPSVLCIGNDITKFLSYEEAIKYYAIKKKKRYCINVSGS